VKTIQSKHRRALAAFFVPIGMPCATACTYDFDQFVESSAGGTSAAGTVQQAVGGSTISASTGGRAATGGTISSPSTGGTSSRASACAGVSYQGLCWYLGSTSSSCQQFCSSHGQVASTMANYVGTTAQGGSMLECTAILMALGVLQVPSSGTRTDGSGLGCHLFSGSPWWLSSPAFSASASDPGARIVCGCTQ